MNSESTASENQPLLPNHHTTLDGTSHANPPNGSIKQFFHYHLDVIHLKRLFSKVSSIINSFRSNYFLPNRLLIYQVAFLSIWLLLNLLLVHRSWFLSKIIEPHHFPQPIEPEWLGCVQSFWLKDDGCGLNGQNCLSFQNVTLPFRCPSRCGPQTGLLNPRVVGAHVANYQPLVIGGGGEGKRYRPDSFICQSAVHAGVISARWGGCGVVKVLGETDGFEPIKANGIRSIGFRAPFPASFIFLDGAQGTACNDLWIHIILLNILCSLIFTAGFSPSPQMFFWTLCFVGYWTVVGASEPNALPPSLSKALADFLPFLFVCYWLWNTAWSITIEKISTLGRISFYLVPCWLGTLLNLTFGWVPIDRLTVHDLQQRPGGILAISILVTLIALLTSYQIWCFSQAKRLKELRFPYAMLGLVLVSFSAVPQHSLRLHHYVIGIFLSPLTGVPTNVSAILQAFLLGIIQNGVARWSFSSILEPTSEVTSDEYDESQPMASFDLDKSGLINEKRDLRLFWTSADADDRPQPSRMVGLMINDLLRFITAQNPFIVQDFLNNLTVPTSTISIALASVSVEQVFLRLAYFREAYHHSNRFERIGEFTGPVTFFPQNQTWLGPVPVY